MKRVLLCAIVFAFLTSLVTLAKPKPHKHCITIRFDYDFGATPACSSEATKVTDAKRNICVEDFVVYDISVGAGRRTKLAVIPVPAGAHGPVKGISGKTPPLYFAPGEHIIAVVARTPDGKESDPYRCSTSVKIRK